MFSMSRQATTGQVNHSKPPPNLDFLLILSEFSHRLLMVDRSGDRGVLPFLMKQLPEGQFKRIQEKKSGGWEPLLTYYGITRGGVAANVGTRGRKRGPKGERFYTIGHKAEMAPFKNTKIFTLQRTQRKKNYTVLGPMYKYSGTLLIRKVLDQRVFRIIYSEMHYGFNETLCSF